MKKLNLNETIKVRLTDLGKDIYYHQYDDLNECIKARGGKPLQQRYPEVDMDGYTKFQLWCFIELYGPHIGMCKPNVLDDLNIYIDDEKLDDVKVDHPQ